MTISRSRLAVLFVVAALGALVSSLPFFYMLGIAFESHALVLKQPPTFLPQEPTLNNFVRAVTTAGFGRAFLNSVLVSVPATALGVLLSSMLAFGFARFHFPGNRLLFYSLILTLTVPALVLIIPQFVLIRQFGLFNTHWALIFVYAVGGMAFNVFLLRGFFEDMPQELFEAAIVDGANVWQAFRYIALPLAKPALATVTIFTFLGSWDEFTWALTALQDSELYTLPVALRFFQRAFGTEWGLVFAASTIAVIPVVIVFLAFQRHFVSGLMLGGTKG
ncbi:MAG: carbohydrate ABC transporter permease [Chloroflexota bacterium]